MADIRTKYPATSTAALTITLASSPTSSDLLTGQESTAVENSNDDLDALVSGIITVGTTPTANTNIEVWAYSYSSIASGVATYPSPLDGTDSAETLTNSGFKFGALKLIANIFVPATTSNVGYAFSPTSIASLFGNMPQFWGVFVTHNTGVDLNATAGNHSIVYERIQAQTV